MSNFIISGIEATAREKEITFSSRGRIDRFSQEHGEHAGAKGAGAQVTDFQYTQGRDSRH
jgi:hypothetical protein